MVNRIIRTALMQVMLVALIACLTIFYLTPQSLHAWVRSQPDTAVCNANVKTSDTRCANAKKADIPNIVHFVYILKDPVQSDFPFQFSHYLSLYAAWHMWQPDAIYLHTNVDAKSPAVQRARAGHAGTWTQRFFSVPKLIVSNVSVPTHTNAGVEIDSVVHQSDFVRVQAVHDYGGIYIDLDVHALRDIQDLRKSGYNAIGGQQAKGRLNSGTFMSQKQGRMISSWMKRMHQVYDGEWTTHSNQAMTAVANELHNDNCEVLMLPQAAFAPVGWKWYNQERLFGKHYRPSNVDYFKYSDKLEDFSSDAGRSWYSWAYDFSCSYLLHAFSSQKARNGIMDNGITPRSILERRSNFARAVYPILQDMYKNGYIDVQDFRTDV